ncbi:LysE family transporter [Candidatus Uhrbacteria bacterium]|nr:LysE family transporter [Candidatus Uhrbacteria bacterium]
MMNVGIFLKGLFTGLILQLAVGPVFFFIVNLTLQKSFLNGLAGVLAVTTVDYFYIALAILGVGKLLEKKKFKKIFGLFSSLILIVFGTIMINGIVGKDLSHLATVNSSSFVSSFTSVFLLTISSPMTIVFFTGLFSAKAIEYRYTKPELVIFGLSTGLATFLFMGTSVIVFSLVKEVVPLVIIQILNFIVGILLIGYGIIRIKSLLKISEHKD